MADFRWVTLRYRTYPERIARVLPPPLQPDDDPIVVVDWVGGDWSGSGGVPTVFTPAPYFESGFHVAARYRGNRGLFQVQMPLDGDWGRIAGRESVGHAKKDGKVIIERDGSRVCARLERRGQVLHRIQTVTTQVPAHPLDWPREFGWGAFIYRFRLHADWREGLIDGPVELWRLGGADDGFPTDAVPDGPGVPRACDLSQTSFAFPEPTALDPVCEFPVRELVGASFMEGSVADRRRARRVPPPRSRRLEAVDAETFEPWALYHHDRPITQGRVWAPAGWPSDRTALKISPDELTRYRSREHLELHDVDLIDVELSVDRALVARTLPPGCTPMPGMRVLACRVGKSDLSPVAYDELWLLARCAQGWYALAHHVTEGGDLMFGRETFGHPSRLSELDIRLGDSTFSVVGTNVGRTFAALQGCIQTPSQREVEDWALIGLRTAPWSTPEEMSARLVLQPWRVEAEWRQGRDVAIDLPDSAAPGIIGKTDPWFEIGEWPVTSARVGRGRILRWPGSPGPDVADPAPFVLERFYGVFEMASVRDGSRSTFLVRPEA